MKPLTRDEIRGIDRCAIEMGVPGVVLMENAGRNVADAVEAFVGGPSGGSAKVAIVAGGGNNGGDGFVVARHLALRNHPVTVFLVAPREKISGDAEINFNILLALSFDIRQGTDALAGELKTYDVIVDAVGGTGVRGELRGWMLEAVNQINQAARPVVAVDVPTGLDCDAGMPSGPCVRADLTVTFVTIKTGFKNPMSKEFTGIIKVADIGIPPMQVARLAAGSQ